MKPAILLGDCRDVLNQIEPGTVQTCVTSPPYWGLRSYLPKDHPDKHREIGQEKTPDDFVQAMLDVFGGKDNPVGAWRALRDDGTLWLNLGDSYAGGGRGSGGNGINSPKQRTNMGAYFAGTDFNHGLKPKDLIGIPWRVAFALQAAGWYLRSDIIWAKPNPMPESVTDRPTRSHEYIFLLSKSPRYYYDANAIKEPPSPELLQQIADGYNGHATKDFLNGKAQDASATKSRIIDGYRKRIDKQREHGRRHNGFNDRWNKMTLGEKQSCGANKRDVWRVATANYKEAHFATFPPKLITPCILAGCPRGGTVLDPFGGSGTVGRVALEHGRNAILVELNPEYIPMAERRCHIPINPQLELINERTT